MEWELIKAFINDHLKRSIVELISASELTDELKEIAEKRGIDLENCDKDFAFFKNIYAVVDVPNGNKCIVPGEKIEPVLASIILKPININHIRKYTVGIYLDAKLEEGMIYSYGVFFKANFQDEWKEMQGLFEKGKLTTSFEIWCPKDKRTTNADGTYSLDEPIIAGGALLFNVKPACKEAKVLELALEKVKESTLSDKFSDLVAASQVPDDEIVTSAYSTWQMNEIENMIQSVPCPECGEVYFWKINIIDFESQEVMAECFNCGLGVKFYLKPEMEIAKVEEVVSLFESKQLTYKERKELKDSDFALVIKKEDGKKIRMFPSQDADHVRNALSRLGQEKVQQNLEKMGVSIKAVLKNVLAKAKKLGLTDLVDKYKANKEEEKMDEKIKELEAEIAKLKADLETANASLKTKDEQIAALEEAKKQLSESAQEELKKVEAQIEAAKKEATVVAQRKVELGESAKDMSDADILNDDKFELAKSKKEKAELEATIAELKKKVPTETETAALARGAGTAEDEAKQKINAARERINKMAFGK